MIDNDIRHLDDPLLSLPRVSVSPRSINHFNQVEIPIASSSAAATNHPLANYASFSLSFLFKPLTVTPQLKRYPSQRKNYAKMHKKSRNSTAITMPYVGKHWYLTTTGTFAPLPLLDLCIRRICTQLMSHQQDALQKIPLPPEMALKLVQWLQQHQILEKPQFQALVPFLILEWSLKNQQEVEDSWFDHVPETTASKVKKIDVSGCIHLQHLGSKKQRIVKLSELVIASFRGCSELVSESIDMLKVSTKLAVLDLSGCVNLDDKSLRILGTLERLKSLQLRGCHKVNNKGVKYLLTMIKLEKLHLGRCRKLTDCVFDGFGLAFVELRELDVANCRLSDKAMQHFGRIKSLEVLVIRGCQEVSDESVKLLCGLIKMKYFDARHCSKVHSIPTEWIQLRVLLLGYTAFADSDASVLQYLIELQELQLRKCRIAASGFQFTSRLKHLERLDIGETSLTDSGLLEICNGARNLKALNIADTEVSDNGTSGLSNLKELRVLCLDTRGITNRTLANVSLLSRLEKLDLFGANITDSGFLHLVRLHKLQELSICGGNISGRGVRIISKLTSLTSLNLSQNRNIKTKSMFYLRSLTGLRCLNLSNTGISALSLRYLSPLKELQYLSVYGCSLSQRQIIALREILPELKCLRCT